MKNINTFNGSRQAHRFLGILASIWLLANCTDRTRHSSLDYIENNFRKYLWEIHKQTPESNRAYYVINLEACSSCVNKHLEFLKNGILKPGITVIFTGLNSSRNWHIDINRLSAFYPVLLTDYSKSGVRYNFGLQNPVYLKFNDGVLTEFVYIQSANEDSVFTHLLRSPERTIP